VLASADVCYRMQYYEQVVEGSERGKCFLSDSYRSLLSTLRSAHPLFVHQDNVPVQQLQICNSTSPHLVVFNLIWKNKTDCSYMMVNSLIQSVSQSVCYTSWWEMIYNSTSPHLVVFNFIWKSETDCSYMMEKFSYIGCFTIGLLYIGKGGWFIIPLPLIWSCLIWSGRVKLIAATWWQILL
jgi:hypothetical protein